MFCILKSGIFIISYQYYETFFALHYVLLSLLYFFNDVIKTSLYKKGLFYSYFLQNLTKYFLLSEIFLEFCGFVTVKLTIEVFI